MRLTDFLKARLVEDEADGHRRRDVQDVIKVLAARRILHRVETNPVLYWTSSGELLPAGLSMLGPLAQKYAAHPDYRDEWQVDTDPH